jgi:ferredoxin
MSLGLRVDRIACTGHGLCADLVPELIQLDEWGYPILAGDVPPALAAHARRAVRACPTLALKLSRAPASKGTDNPARPLAGLPCPATCRAALSPAQVPASIFLDLR